MRNNFPRIGIRLRVLAISLAPAMLITLGLIGYFVHTRISDFDQALHNRAIAIGEYLAPASEYGVLSGNAASLAPLMSFAKQDADIRNIIIFSRDGEIISESAVPQVSPEFRIEATQNDDIVYRRPIYLTEISINDDLEPVATPNGNETIGWVEVHLSRHSTSQKQFEVLYKGLLLSAIVLIISTIYALRIGRSVTEPILSMTQAVSNITRGTYGTNLHIHTGSELDSMADGINAMSAEIRKSKESLQGRINEATNELQVTIHKLDDARKKAEQANKTKSIFLANMSHEIRTPLNAIIGFTKLLLKTCSDGNQASQLKIIDSAGTSLSHIINDILDISRIESGSFTLHPTPSNLHSCVEKTIALLAPAAFAKGIELTYLIYDDVPENVIIDELRLSQILTNLINNAIKFTRYGAVELRVMLADQHEDSHLIQFEIKDTGIGISAESQKSLFNAFTQADSSISRDYGGSGLGLSICKKITELMNGSIALRSEVGLGTTVELCLPSKIATEASQDLLHTPDMAYQDINVHVYAKHALTRLRLMQAIRRRGGTPVGIESISEPLKQDNREERPANTALGETGTDSSHDMLIVCLDSSEAEDFDYLGLRNKVNSLGIPLLILTPDHDAITAAEDARLDMYCVELRHMGNESIYRSIDCLLHSKGQQAAQPSEASPHNNSTHHKVMVVDDNAINMKLIVALLDNLGIETIQASNGQMATALYPASLPDLVFMDVHMPGISGLDAAAMINMQYPWYKCPIVALTADFTLNEQELIDSGIIDGVMLKPISEEDLINNLRLFLPECRIDNSPTPHTASGKRPPSTPTPVIYNRRLALQRCNGDKVLADNLLQMALRELPVQRSEILQRKIPTELDAIGSLAHAIRGTASYCCLNQLEESATSLEAVAKNKDSDGVRNWLPVVLRDIDNLLKMS